MKIYKARVHGHVTIFREEYMSVAANSKEEAAEMFYDAFRQSMDEQYGWADVDEVFWDEVEVC